MAAIAAGNRGGTIAQDKINRLRAGIAAGAEKLGVDAVVYGLREALLREKIDGRDPLAYAKAVAKSYDPAKVTPFKRREKEYAHPEWSRPLEDLIGGNTWDTLPGPSTGSGQGDLKSLAG